MFAWKTVPRSELMAPSRGSGAARERRRTSAGLQDYETTDHETTDYETTDHETTQHETTDHRLFGKG
jgi:hypothetical protein